MRDLASIERIKKLEPLEGKDKIELATINDWEVIVEKGQFNVGDLVVYIEYDTVLPEIKEFEFLRSRCWSKTYQGFRIRNMKMAGVYSQGIVFPLSILKKGNGKEGTPVAKELGIVRYAPQEKNIRNPFLRFLMKFKITRFFVLHKKSTIEYPSTVAKSDETNIQKNFNILSNHHGLFYRSEKLEGQSATFMRLKNKYLFFSHNCYRDDKTPSTWKTISNKYNMKELLMKYPESIAVQGEIIGEGIQGNIYGLKGIDFYVF